MAKKFLGLGEGNGDHFRGWVTLIGRDLKKEESDGFADAAVRAVVSAACNGEVQLRFNKDDTVIPYDRKGVNPLLDLLYQPTPAFNENVFKQIIVSQMLIYGNVFIWKDARDSKNRPTRLIPVPQPFIAPMLDVYGFPYAYKISYMEGTYTVPKEDIIHIHEGNEIDLFMGRSRMLKAKIDSDTLNSAKSFNLAFFKNGASLGGVISFPEGQKVPKQEMDEMLKYFNSQYQGSEKAHRTAIIQRGGKYESFKATHKDMEYGEGMKFHEQQILSIAGVPPAMVGKFEYAPQFNTKEQQKIFYETNVIPLMRLFADAFSEELVPDFYPKEEVYICYDFSNVKALEPNYNELADAALKFCQIWPTNEVKKMLRLPFGDIQGGDEPPNPVLSAFGLNAEVEGKKEIQTKKARIVRASPALIKKHKAEKEKFIKEQSKVMQESIKSHFTQQCEIVENYFKNDLDKPFIYDDCFGSLATQRDLLLVVKVPAMAEIFASALEFEQGYIQSILPKKDFKFMDKKAMKDRVEEWARINAFKWADSIEHTTLERLDRIVKIGVENGYSNRQINNIILQFFSERGYEPTTLTPNENGANISIYNRVETIVRTETRNTISEAQVEAFKSTPFVNGKVWITTLGVTDHHAGHEEMDGQEVGINEKFYNPFADNGKGGWAEAPCHFGLADQDINCLCDMSPTIIDED